jgi:small subunit ribosomal protein S17
MAEKKTTKAPAAQKSKTTATAEKKTAAKATPAKKTAGATAEKTVEEKNVAKAAAPRKVTAKTTAPDRAKPVAKAAAPVVKRARPLRRAQSAQGSAQDAPAHSWRRSRRRTRVGVVSSAKQPHTVTVVVERMREHPLYKKVIRLRKKYAAHDAAGDVKAGDLVRIQESRPFSATKHWQVVEVLSRAGEAGAAAPRAEEVEKLLEQAEGVDVILAPQREEKVAEPVAEGTAE